MGNKPLYVLENWSMIVEDDPYKAPELIETYLIGKVYGQPGRPFGHKIQTSPIVGVDGRNIETMNSIYALGLPDVTYSLWCEEIGKPIDYDNPIKLKK